MTEKLGFTRSGLDLAVRLKESYADHKPLVLGDESNRLLMPEHLINAQIDLQEFEDPLPLAVVAARDPDSPMSVAAAVRLSSKAAETRVGAEVFGILGKTSKHSVVKSCVELVQETSFNPKVLTQVRNNASKFIEHSRKQYTDALRANLRLLIDGSVDPRVFVDDFFELAEAGNLRLEVRKRLILSLLTSETIRPRIKFLFLENLDRLPPAVFQEVVSEALGAPDRPGLDAIKTELTWIERDSAAVH